MPRLRKGELSFYKLMNPTEISEYVQKFPENTEYVKYFLEQYKYLWRSEKWEKGRTI